MKAPDKIYLQRNTTIDLYDVFWPEWFEDTNCPDSDICYIRKDALLEITETARASAVVQRNFNNCPVEQEARIDAYEYIVNKIKSL